MPWPLKLRGALVSIRLCFADLRRHVIGRADHRSGYIHGALEHAGDAEVADAHVEVVLHAAASGQEDVGALPKLSKGPRPCRKRLVSPRKTSKNLLKTPFFQGVRASNRDVGCGAGAYSSRPRSSVQTRS